MFLLPDKYSREYAKGVYSEEAKYHIESIYGNKLLGGAKPNSSHYGIFHGDLNIHTDQTTLYRHNNFGYRSDFWDGSHQILALGCSNTYGAGIPEEGRWTDILQELSNKKVANLSCMGQSINFLISQAFAYFKTFGNPEYVVCLLPDPLRIYLPTNGKLLDSKNNNGQLMKVIYVNSNEYSEDKPKYLKKPYYYEDVLPVDVSLFFSMQSIHALEQYCNSHKIKLIWSSWETHFQDFISTLSDISLNNFIKDDSLKIIDSYLDAECHLNYKEKFDYYFVHGRDDEPVSRMHPGVHKNIHVAECFYEEFKKL
jgi:hypothetical protein